MDISISMEDDGSSGIFVGDIDVNSYQVSGEGSITDNYRSRL